jgi:hypothetical protein
MLRTGKKRHPRQWSNLRTINAAVDRRCRVFVVHVGSDRRVEVAVVKARERPHERSLLQEEEGEDGRSHGELEYLRKQPTQKRTRAQQRSKTTVYTQFAHKTGLNNHGRGRYETGGTLAPVPLVPLNDGGGDGPQHRNVGGSRKRQVVRKTHSMEVELKRARKNGAHGVPTGGNQRLGSCLIESIGWAL